MIYVVGILSGVVSGLFGAGGGLILLPCLVSFFNIDEYKARGTTLASILVASLVTAVFYMKNNYFDISLSFKVALGGIVGGFIGAKFIKKIPKDILRITFAAFVIFISWRMIFNK